MSLPIGTRLGPYEIVSALGAGGMGEVYRARDTRLNRDVAIKILPELFAADADRSARFEREARVISQLNHPNICALFDVSVAPNLQSLNATSDRIQFLVLELVDGSTLADRIEQGALPIEEALDIARQIAAALEAAHDNGIIHRDLKPANIKLTKDGTVKVLDFGLAKATDRRDGSKEHEPAHGVSESPTITSPAMNTHAGVILGTAVYMSPEQAKGKPADKRSDVWAFGCVLFEMLTGKRAFDGEDLTDVVAAVVRGEPDWSALPPNVPEYVRTLVKGCLEKDRKARIGDIAVARFLLDKGAALPVPNAASTTERSNRSLTAIVALVAGIVLLIAAVVGVILWRPHTIAPSAPIRLTVEAASDVTLATQFSNSVALSSDGTTMALVASPAGANNPSLYLRRLNQLDASLLPGTEGAFNPFFSPDGEWIGFFAQGKLKKISVAGGAPATVCDAGNIRGGSWSEDGWIYFTVGSAARQGVWRVLAEGGIPENISDGAGKDAMLRWPDVLPGSKAILYTVQPPSGNYEQADVIAFSLTDRTSKVVLQGGYHARYVPSGHIVYVKGGSLFAAPFDVETLSVTGRSVPAVEGILTSTTTGSVQYSVSDNGTIVYVAGDSAGNKAPIRWIDRTGKTELLRSTPADWSNPSISADGRKLAIDIHDGTQTDVWVYEWVRDTLSRLTFDRADDVRPVWSPGGRYIAFASRRNGASNLYMQRSDGTGDVLRLTDSPNPQFASSWDPSGKYLAFFEVVPGKASDVMILPLAGDETTGWTPGKPQTFLSSTFNEGSAMFSPDGRWLAYMSNESGRNEIFVRPFPGPGGKWQISTTPADDPTWSRASNELLYLNVSDQRLMSVPYRAQGDSFQADKPVVWLNGRVTSRPRPPSRDLDLHPDGKRVVVGSSEEQSAPEQNRVVFVFNFLDELKRIAPSKRRD